MAFTLLHSCITSSGRIKKTIKGKWCVYTDKVNYPKIEFGPKYRLTLMSSADTIYSHKYHLKKNKVGIILSLSDTVYHEILKLTKDSLTLKSLLENKEVQKYFRCEMVESSSLN
jgi:hypothetical protein